MTIVIIALKMSANKQSSDKKADEFKNAFTDELMLELIDEVACGLCFEVHRASKLGTLFLDETDIEWKNAAAPDASSQDGSNHSAADNYKIVNEQGLDVFGQLPSKKQYECICPSCERNMAAARFAPHLEKCMGMGRNSSRIASRRIAHNTVGRKGSDAETDGDDNSNDASYAPDRKAKRLKRDKHTVASKRAKTNNSKVKAVDSPTVASHSETLSRSSSQPVFDTLSYDDKKKFMVHTCGVISEHTQKMCTRSLKCPQHTDRQRQAVREFLLRPHSAISLAEDPVDVDSLDDMMMAGPSLVTWDTVSNPSPSGSGSTIHSSSSTSRRHKTTIAVPCHASSQKRSSLPHPLPSHSNISGTT